MSSPDKLTGEKVTNAVNTDDFGGNSTRLDDPGGGSASATSTGNVMDHMGDSWKLRAETNGLLRES